MPEETKKPWPKSVKELKDGGYQFEGRGRCRSCQGALTWAKTPGGKMMSLTLIAEATFDPHFAHCPRWPKRPKVKTA